MKATNALTTAQRMKLGAIVSRRGLAGACNDLNLGREVVVRLLAGVDVRSATLVVATTAIENAPDADKPRKAASATKHVKFGSYRVLATSRDGARPTWLDAWADQYLTDEQRESFERNLAANAPEWAR